jgi:DNA-directed RNA polymerase subunit RPC12/RpoP
MAETITIVCPSCGKKLKGPANIEGRKIRCKVCKHAFVAKEHSPEGSVYGTEKEQTLEEIRAPAQEESSDKKEAASAKTDKAPVVLYDFTDEKAESVPRCPQCAFEMESADAIVCLHCGYNLLSRQRLQMVKTYRITFWDWTFWLTPPIASAVFSLVCIGTIVFLWLIPRFFPDSWFDIFALRVWGSVILAGMAWSSGKYAFKKLVFNFRPPEKIKR